MHTQVIFYWSLWELGFKNNKVFTVPLAIALGICLQAALWLIYLFGPLLVAILYNMDRFGKRSVLRDWPNSLRAALIVLFFVASIIIGQFMLWRNGVFLADGVSTSLKVVDVAALLPLVKNYLVKALQTLGPYTPVAAAVMLGALILGFGKLSSTQRFFLASWLLGPCWLFVLEPRSSIHILISVEIALLIIGAILLTKLWARQTLLPKVIVAALVGTYLFSNLMMLRAHQLLSSNIFSPQQGSNLADQLALIDYTYAQAAAAPFTFSAFTNPNGYFITWAYLYDWYGQNKYGYKPTFVGPEQTGLFGADLLARDDVSRAAVHFTIIEPNLDIVPQVTRDAFSAEQERLAPVAATTVFGSTVVELRLLE